MPKADGLPAAGRGLLAKLVIYDISSRLVETILNKTMNPGSYEAEWDGSNYSSGVYFYKLGADKYVNTKKMVLLK